MFTNSSIQSTINRFDGTSFINLKGFGIYSSSNTTYYYVMEYGANKVYIFNEEWKFISFKNFDNPNYMISIGNSYYVTNQFNISKLDKDLNILRNYNSTGVDPRYRGISYNPSNWLVYVAAADLNEIQVFNLDLTLIRHFSTSPCNPYSITESSNKLYVGTFEGIILVYQNETIIHQFNGCDGDSASLTSIYFDQNGFIATSCFNSKLYLFSQNGSFTGKSIATSYNPYYIGFDSKGRFIQIPL